MSAQHGYTEIEAALASIVPAGTVFEIRCLSGNRKRVDAGYFDSPAAAATALSAIDGQYQGIYVTPNPVLPELFARSANRISTWANSQTHDPDVVRRKWLLVDVDPKRPSGISSTDQEHRAALNKAEAIAFMLKFECGFPDPMFNSSGNGAHLMYGADLPNTDEVRDAVQLFLRCLAARHNDTVCEVDTTVFNAARIWRVPGTWARKGDSVPDRPHRKACTVRSGNGQVEFDQIQAFNARNQHLLIDARSSSGNGQAGGSTNLPVDERKYKFLNDHAMRRIPEWVPVFFPDAREYKQGYRVSSNDLGRNLEEDLTIHPWPLGIKDFGVSDQGDSAQGRRTPVGLLAEFCFGGDKAVAAQKLADVLKAPVTEFTDLNIGTGPEPMLPGIATPRPRFDFGNVRSIHDLTRRDFAPVKYVIENVLPTGNIMLAARPKMRKTWLALQLGMAVATGGRFLEWDCNQGDVLLLMLEDNEKRIRSRIRTLQTFEMCPPDLSNLRYWTGGMETDARGKLVVSNPEEHARTYQTFPRGEAGVDALEQYLELYPNTSMIVIDTFQHFRGTSAERDIYQRDYNEQMPITRLAARKGVLIMPVHHEKKGLAGQESGDFLEDVNGSSGITGGSDGVISIKGRRGVQEENETRKLFITGRDVPHDFEVDMSFDAERGGWLPAARTDVKVALRTLFERHPFINQQELAALLPNVPKARLTRCLTEMKFEGEITQSKFGYSKART